MCAVYVTFCCPAMSVATERRVGLDLGPPEPLVEAASLLYQLSEGNYKQFTSAAQAPSAPHPAPHTPRLSWVITFVPNIEVGSLLGPHAE